MGLRGGGVPPRHPRRGAPSPLIRNASRESDFGPVTAARWRLRAPSRPRAAARGPSRSRSSASRPLPPPLFRIVSASLALAHAPVRSPGRDLTFLGQAFLDLLGKELCSPLPAGGTPRPQEVRETCLELGAGPRAPSPSLPPSGGRAGRVRGGGGGRAARPPRPGELVPGVVLAALSPALRFPPRRRPPERSGNETGCAQSGTVSAVSKCACSGPGCRGLLVQYPSFLWSFV